MNSRNEAHEPGERRLAARERKEHREPGVAWVDGGQRSARPTTSEAGSGGQRWVGTWANLGKGGLMVGKRTGFSHLETALTHLFPLDSTQVVDFPHLSGVSIFRGRAKNSRISGRGMIGRGIGMKAKRSLGPRWGRPQGGTVAGCLASQARHEMGAPVELFAGAKRGRESARSFTKVRESPRKFAQIRPVIPRCYALLRVGAIF